MNFTNLVKRALRPIAKPVLDVIAARVANRARHESIEETLEFELRLLATLRSLTTRSDHRVVLPYDSAKTQRTLKELKVGFFGNIANNAYNFTKCLRRLGYDVELVIEDGWFDAFLMNRPFWEDLEVECDSYEEGLTREQQWNQPDCVRRVAFDPQMQARFQGRYGAVQEVQALYKQAFGLELSADRALLLAQQMGHWPFLLAMKRYDVVQFSGAAISMGMFCPRPYVAFPTGGDLFISPFEETVFGLLMRTGYQRASHILFCAPNYPEYLDRLELAAPRSFAPLMIDTDTYAPGGSDDVRAKWRGRVGGKRFLLQVCRQSWEWKGNDGLCRAFAALLKNPAFSDWRLVLTAWGPDVEKTKQLIAEMGFNDKVYWEKLASKSVVRKRQRSADLVADQFVMPGYGTSVLESMAVGKPVMVGALKFSSIPRLPKQPPFLTATNQEDILRALSVSDDDPFLVQRGKESLEWVQRYHSHVVLADVYLMVYQSALGLSAGAGSTAKGRSQSSPSVPAPHHEDISVASRQFLQGILQAHGELRRAMKERFDRSVPLADELTDRWERARFLGFGERSTIYDSALVLGQVKVGNDTWIGPNCILDGSGGLEIGSSCSIASGCHLYSHETVDWALSGGKSAYQRKPTQIGDACYLGPHSVVTAGVTIGNHCLVSALSFVNRDVQDYSIVAGIPAQVIGHVRVGPDGTVTRVYDEKPGMP